MSQSPYELIRGVSIKPLACVGAVVAAYALAKPYLLPIFDLIIGRRIQELNVKDQIVLSKYFILIFFADGYIFIRYDKKMNSVH